MTKHRQRVQQCQRQAQHKQTACNLQVLLCLATAGNYLVDAAGSLLLSREASLVPTVMSLMTIGLALYLLVKVCDLVAINCFGTAYVPAWSRALPAISLAL